ncbi:MAG: Arc family DNA-binding protein [Clostridia bacterium]|nr:Arc family DNA-binding protein [Clostridia bacterium]
MAIQANPYPLRLEKELLEKAKVIAKENGRSLNKEIEFLLKNAIKEYEAKNGTINVDTL